MKPKAGSASTDSDSTRGKAFTELLSILREVILGGRRQALRAVDTIQVATCWSIGHHIVEFEQGGAERASYGDRLLPRLAGQLTLEFGKGFDASNLYKMSLFYRHFPNLDALRPELSWTHYRLLSRVEDAQARLWYMNEAAAQNWNTRALDRQIGTLYYERLLASKDREPVREEAAGDISRLALTPRDFIHDPVLLEFLGLPGTGKLLESRLEDALIGNLQAFLLELGKGFAFVARGSEDNPSVGIILCAQKDQSVVRYSVLSGNEQLFASKSNSYFPLRKSCGPNSFGSSSCWKNRQRNPPRRPGKVPDESRSPRGRC